jgi:hypothetical protein
MEAFSQLPSPLGLQAAAAWALRPQAMALHARATGWSMTHWAMWRCLRTGEVPNSKDRLSIVVCNLGVQKRSCGCEGTKSDMHRCAAPPHSSTHSSACRLWGAQTQRAVQNFRIGDAAAERMPEEMIRAMGLIKAAAAQVCLVGNQGSRVMLYLDV